MRVDPLFLSKSIKANRGELLDLLHLIKRDHEAIRSGIKSVLEGSMVSCDDQILVNILAETEKVMGLKDDLLYPEAENVGNQVSRCLERVRLAEGEIREQIRQIRRFLEQCSSSGESEIVSIFNRLHNLIESYFTLEEEWLLPRLRQIIPTSFREDLGELYFEACSENRNWNAPELRPIGR